MAIMKITIVCALLSIVLPATKLSNRITSGINATCTTAAKTLSENTPMRPRQPPLFVLSSDAVIGYNMDGRIATPFSSHNPRTMSISGRMINTKAQRPSE
ncbi:hypothetical protein DPMN_053321 [Dreissena polymorpha]|uniref:Secreted protein n=1 Tax=Dreissena polymorpha TaxID=45954 RepID=A0A9D4CMU2_DREPO|nr:hypothetical protein DPMN_053321 [Dreissena polymorpha]